jgi:hypothetical protein
MRPRYAAAWKELLRGDADAYVKALKSAGYFTANEESYKAAVSSLQREYLRLIDAPVVVPPEKPQPLAGPVSVAESVVSDALRELRDTDPAPPPSGAVS